MKRRAVATYRAELGCGVIRVCKADPFCASPAVRAPLQPSDERTLRRRVRCCTVSGTELVLSGGGNVKLATTPTVAEPSGYFQWKLLNKSLAYTVDLSRVGCSCNAALYLVSMPGYNASSGASPDPRSDYYCGANAGKPSDNTSAVGGNGNYCPEMDVLEANKFAAQSTPHICNGT